MVHGRSRTGWCRCRCLCSRCRLSPCQPHRSGITDAALCGDCGSPLRDGSSVPRAPWAVPAGLAGCPACGESPMALAAKARHSRAGAEHAVQVARPRWLRVSVATSAQGFLPWLSSDSPQTDQSLLLSWAAHHLPQEGGAQLPPSGVGGTSIWEPTQGGAAPRAGDPLLCCWSHMGQPCLRSHLCKRKTILGVSPKPSLLEAAAEPMALLVPVLSEPGPSAGRCCPEGP